MFSFLKKKKKEKTYQEITRHILTIQLVENKELNFKSTTEDYPEEWENLFWWYQHTRGLYYSFPYNDGEATFSRDNIIFIKSLQKTDIVEFETE